MFRNFFRGIGRQQVTTQPVTQKVVSRTEPQSGKKRAVFATTGVTVEPGLPVDRLWPGMKNGGAWQGREIK